jgi:hypothetical protein
MMRWSLALSPHQYSRLRARPWMHGWLLFCLMFGVMAPGLSHAIVNLSVQDEHKIAVCTASAMTYIRWHNTETSPAAQPSHQFPQCLICTFTTDTPLGAFDCSLIANQTPEKTQRQTLASLNRSPCYWLIAAIRAPPVFFSNVICSLTPPVESSTRV